MVSKQQNAKVLCGKLVGMTEDDAVELVERGKFRLRITMRDRCLSVCTRDYDTTRINLEIINGLVTDARVG